MKKLLTLIFLLLFSICSFGQGENENLGDLKMTETDSLYFTAINKYIQGLDSYNNLYSKQKSPKIIFIEFQEYLWKIPDSINGYKIQKIGFGNRKKVFRQNKNKLRLVKVSPLTLENEKFQITLTPYSARLKRKKHLFLSLSHWINFFFEFKDGHLIYKKTENNGI